MKTTKLATITSISFLLFPFAFSGPLLAKNVDNPANTVNSTDLNNRNSSLSPFSPKQSQKTNYKTSIALKPGSDADIVSQIKNAIARDIAISADGKMVDVVATNDTITLAGMVKNAEERARIEAVAKNINSVRVIHNNLTIEKSKATANDTGEIQ